MSKGHSLEWPFLYFLYFVYSSFHERPTEIFELHPEADHAFRHVLDRGPNPSKSH
jgi:hypothetical protein